jgi:hypothetical protein
MQYLLLIYTEDGVIDDSQRQACYAESTEYAHKLAAAGKFLGAAPLHPTSTATSVRIRDGKPIVTDGPFAETREHLGGFFLVNARDLDDAISIAAGIPAGKWGTVEIRPVVEIPNLPKPTPAADLAGSVTR